MIAEITSPAVLVVEDEPLIRDLIEAMLEDGGFTAKFATTGEAAMSALSNPVDDVIAMITDIDLGRGPNGWEVARHARRLNPELPVVYMSGASAGGWTSEGVPNSTMVPKPFAAATLLVALASCLNTRDSNNC